MFCVTVALFLAIFVSVARGDPRHCDALHTWVSRSTVRPPHAGEASDLYALVGALMSRGVLSSSDIVDALLPLTRSVYVEAKSAFACSENHVNSHLASAAMGSGSTEATVHHHQMPSRRLPQHHPELSSFHHPRISRRLLTSLAPYAPSLGDTVSMTSSLSDDCAVLAELQNSTIGTSFVNASCLSDCCSCVEVRCNEVGLVISLAVRPAGGSVPSSIWQLQSLEYLRVVAAEYGVLSDIGLLQVLVSSGVTTTAIQGVFPFPLLFPVNFSSLIVYGSFTGQLPTSLPPFMRSFQVAGSFSGVLSTSLLSCVSFSVQIVGSFQSRIPAVLLQPSLRYLSIEGCSGGTLNSLQPFPVQLLFLDLSGNQLTGPIPESLGFLLQLQQLFLPSNQLSGSIPESLGKLAQLQQVYLSSNQLSGSIPQSLGSLTQLQFLGLFSNLLSGSIPPSLGNLAHLQYLGLFSNQLTGPIPESLGNLKQLQYMVLFSNRLSGPIPKTLGNLTQLQYMVLFLNELSGPIPKSLGNLVQLQQLWLTSNQLGGSIPASLGNLGQLQHLGLASNLLSGPIPDSLGNLTQMQYLDLSSNQLSGQIPQSFGNLTKVQFLDLSSNKLSGSIPLSLSNLTALQYLYLYSNELSDALPPSLNRMHSLVALDVHDNRLTGAVPMELCELSLWQVSLSENQLTFFPPCEFALWVALDISSNALTNFPFASVFLWPRLVSLDVSRNNLFSDHLPAIPLGSSLRSLAVSHCNMSTYFPIAPCGSFVGSPLPNPLHGLSFLDMSGNRITGFYIGDWNQSDVCTFCSQPSFALSSLKLANCQLTSYARDLDWNGACLGPVPIASFLSLFPTLQSIDLSFNHIDGALDDIFGLPQIAMIDLRGNPTRDTRLSFALRSNFHVDSSTLYAYSASMECYQPTFGPSLQLSVDPSFFDYRYCQCRSGYYKKPPNCLPCAGTLDHAECSFASDSIASSMDPIQAWNLSGNVIALDGYYASPSVSYEEMYYNRSYPSSIEICVGAGTDRTPCKATPQGGPCATGYDGRLCSGCAKGYFRTGDACTVCPGEAGLVFFGMAFVLAVVALVVWSFFVGTSASGFAKILILFLQCMFYVRPTMPPSLYSFTHGTSSFAMLSLAGPKCILPAWSYETSYATAIVSAVILPLCSFVICAIGWLFMGARKQFTVSAALAWLDRCRRSALFLAVFLYMPAVNAILAPLACATDDGDGHDYLVSVPYVRCSPTLRAWSIALVLLYIIGFPAGCAVLVYRSRAHTQDEHMYSRRRYLYSLLFGSYRPSCYAWELAVTLRRIVLIAAFATVPRRSALQTSVVAVALGGSLVAHSIVAPYRTLAENAFEAAALTTLLVNYAAELKAQVLGVEQLNAAGAFVFVVDLSVIVVGVACLFPLLAKRILRCVSMFRVRQRSILTVDSIGKDRSMERALLENDGL